MENTPFTLDNIFNAARKCINGVQWKNGTARWRLNLLCNCRRLETEIASGKYKMSPMAKFFIHRPKKREVTSMRMRDRIVHKIICHEGWLIDDLFRGAFFDNCACQKGKGTDFARNRLKLHLRRHFSKHGISGYAMKLDIHKFFQSIPHDRLIDFVFRKVRNPMVRQMVADIISNSGINGIGLDLGSEVSQVLANAYLTPVDYVIKQRCGIEGYVRYADDMVLLIPEDNKDMAKAVLNQVRYALSTLGLELNPKSSIMPIRCGVDFLGFKFKLSNTGKIVTKLSRKNRQNALRHMKRLAKAVSSGTIPKNALLEAFTAWSSHARKATIGSTRIIELVKKGIGL